MSLLFKASFDVFATYAGCILVHIDMTEVICEMFRMQFLVLMKNDLQGNSEEGTSKQELTVDIIEIITELLQTLKQEPVVKATGYF